MRRLQRIKESANKVLPINEINKAAIGCAIWRNSICTILEIIIVCYKMKLDVLICSNIL